MVLKGWKFNYKREFDIFEKKIFNCDVKNAKTNHTMATESSYYYSKSGASQRKSRNNQQSKSEASKIVQIIN